MAATSSTNRIPLHVSHGSTGNTGSNYSTTYEFRSSSGGSPLGGAATSAYDMRGINDENDRIKQRMRDFEKRCKKWREEFFANKSEFQNDFERQPRVGGSGDGGLASDSTNFTFTHHSPSRSPHITSSTMHQQHRTLLEDTTNGGKKYKIEFEIGDFKQNELQISTHGASTLVVKGDRELKAGLATETKTFNREITLPDYVDTSKMNAYLLDANSSADNSNVLIVEAPVLMDKYSYRRSAFDSSQSPVRISTSTNMRTSPTKTASSFAASSSPVAASTAASATATTSVLRNNANSGNENLVSSTSHLHQHHHHQHSSSENKSSTTTTTRVVQEAPFAATNAFNTDLNNNINNSTQLNLRASRSNLSNQTIAPELIKGYPIYDSAEGCVVYKFDLSGFDQTEIQLTITVDRTLEIKATKELQDHLGKIYREFKREIHLESDVDLNAIKNVLHEGILTLKIPKQNRPDGMGSVSNSHNLQSPNGFKEIYTDDGKLIKLTSDFRGYNPENVKIVLSANNVLKVTANQSEQSTNSKGTVQKECTRHYTLPAWVQPENMKAIMSRDGVLNVDIRH